MFQKSPNKIKSFLAWRLSYLVEINQRSHIGMINRVKDSLENVSEASIDKTLKDSFTDENTREIISTLISSSCFGIVS